MCESGWKEWAKIRSPKQAEDTNDSNAISGKRILANVTIVTMLGLGFMYQQGTAMLKVRPPKLTQPIKHQSEAEIFEKELAARELKERSKIVKAISASRTSLDVDDVATLAGIIRRESKKYDYDWKLVLAIIRVESQFDTRARSYKGARGLMQVMPSTAEWLAPKLGLEYSGRDSLYDPEYNVKLGIHYLHMLHQRFGNIEKAIVAYNRGPDGLTRYLRQGRKFPPTYLIKVMDHYKELRDGAIQYAS